MKVPSFSGKCDYLQDLQALQKTFPGLELIKLDVQSDASIKQAFEHISNAVGDGRLNLLIKNSAILEKVRLLTAKTVMI